MMPEKRTLGVVLLALLVAGAVGIAFAGSPSASEHDDQGESNVTLENAQVDTLELENVTVENATLEEVTVDQADIQGINTPSENVTVSDVQIEHLALEGVSLSDVQPDMANDSAGMGDEMEEDSDDEMDTESEDSSDDMDDTESATADSEDDTNMSSGLGTGENMTDREPYHRVGPCRELDRRGRDCRGGRGWCPRSIRRLGQRSPRGGQRDHHRGWGDERVRDGGKRDDGRDR
ncbi:MAG: hypothetical protein U5K37_01140 [Natrialbaceae archaeon]|nr:hypothetical protein [Natrialbaceae archaeon]